MSDNCGHPTGNGGECQNPATEGDHCWLEAHGGDTTPGRETELDEELAESITSNIAEGKSVTSAVRMAGIPKSTYYNWLDRGESEDGTVYAELLDRHVRARGLGEDYIFSTVWEIAEDEGDLATLMSILKQRYPESWGDVDRGEQSSGVTLSLSEDEKEQLDQAFRN